MKKIFACFFVIVTILPSCKLLYPSLMFKQKEYQYFELAHKQIDQYIIQPGDELAFRLYTRDGFKLVDVLSGTAPGSATLSGVSSSFITYPVDNEGFARLPIL